MKLDLDKYAKKKNFKNFEDLIKSLTLDINKVGRLISDKGLQHYVLEYGNTKVIKLPKHNFLSNIWSSRHKEGLRDIKLVSTYFAEYYVNTNITKSNINQDFYVVIQDKLTFRAITKKDFEREIQLRKKLCNFYELYLEFVKKEGYSLDTIGGAGIYPYLRRRITFRKHSGISLTNLVLDNENNLKILDLQFTNLELRRVKNLRDLIIFIYGHIELNVVKLTFSKTFHI